MKKYLLILIAVFSFEYIVFAQNTNNTHTIINLSTERFKAIIANEKNGMVIDLRTTDEISKGFIKGSVQLDFLAKDSKNNIDKLDKNKTYYIYSGDGAIAADAAAYMEKQNFKHVYTLEKGFSDWEKKGFPIEKK
jgi:rhodanese-related sulfurtransferase